MDYKKAYITALAKAREIHSFSSDPAEIKCMEQIFPSLQESEDEKIRRALIRYHQSTLNIDGVKGEEILAWLERQGEQKPTPKVEPKFKVGDWCIDNEDGTIFQVVKVLDNTYTYKTIEGKEYSCTHYSLENDARLWTIQDAKDGDVLAVNGKPFIYYHTDEYNGNYCCIDDKGCFRTNIRFSFEGNCILPATKEQQELLFEKMKEAGYEWDEEKKELRKIEQSELTEFEDAVKDMMNTYRDAIGDNDVTTEEVKKHAAYLLSLIPYKSAEWTDEDECYMGECISAIATKDGWSFEEKRKTKHWLKSLKKRLEEL